MRPESDDFSQRQNKDDFLLPLKDILGEEFYQTFGDWYHQNLNKESSERLASPKFRIFQAAIAFRFGIEITVREKLLNWQKAQFEKKKERLELSRQQLIADIIQRADKAQQAIENEPLEWERMKQDLFRMRELTDTVVAPFMQNTGYRIGSSLTGIIFKSVEFGSKLSEKIGYATGRLTYLSLHKLSKLIKSKSHSAKTFNNNQSHQK